MKKLLASDILKLKGERKIIKVTVLNYFSARAIQETGIAIFIS